MPSCIIDLIILILFKEKFVNYERIAGNCLFFQDVLYFFTISMIFVF